ncbi:MAG: electron transfer flavoprotein, partial [Desulfosarcinaceae bacterium]
MDQALIPPASYAVMHIPLVILSVLIPVTGVAIFTYIIAKRLAPLVKAAPDHRLDNVAQRLKQLFFIWLAQWRQPRYRLAGVLHILIFAG